eukprot:1106325-Alexandrium_andersonii.AAC.1
MSATLVATSSLSCSATFTSLSARSARLPTAALPWTEPRQYCHLILKAWSSPVLKDWGRQKETDRRTDRRTVEDASTLTYADRTTRREIERRIQSHSISPRAP